MGNRKSFKIIVRRRLDYLFFHARGTEPDLFRNRTSEFMLLEFLLAGIGNELWDYTPRSPFAFHTHFTVLSLPISCGLGGLVPPKTEVHSTATQYAAKTAVVAVGQKEHQSKVCVWYLLACKVRGRLQNRAELPCAAGLITRKGER